MKSIRIVFWLQIRYIPHLPPQLWVCLMLQQWQRMWIPANPELQNSSQRLFAMEKEMSHHSLAQSCCCTLLWPLGKGMSCKHHFWAALICSDSSAGKATWSLLTWGRSQIAPKKIQNNEWHLPHLQNECWVLHHVLLKDSSLLLCLRSFFQRLCWHVTTPTFITCRWTFMKQRRIVTLFLIGGNWIWFFIPSKHLFTDRINPMNCFKLCISLQPIMIVTKHVIRANEHNYQCLQIWGFRLFSQTFHMWPFYHWFTFKNRNKLY